MLGSASLSMTEEELEEYRDLGPKKSYNEGVVIPSETCGCVGGNSVFHQNESCMSLPS